MPTGTGKTEFELIVAGGASLDHNVLLMVNTDITKRNAIERAKKLGFENFIPYQKSRGKKSLESKGWVLVSHPTSVLNDRSAGKNMETLASLGTAVADESHHYQSDTWYSTLWALSNLTRSYPFSATPVFSDLFSSYGQLMLSDARTLAAGGPIRFSRMAHEATEFIDRPLLFNLTFVWEEKQGKELRGIELYQDVLVKMSEYERRRKLIVTVMQKLDDRNLSVFLPISLKAPARQLMEEIGRPNVACCFGGGKNFLLGSISEHSTFRPLSTAELKQGLTDGSIRHIIGTSHIDEGFDLPTLNVTFTTEGSLARRQNQRVGRTVRKGGGQPIVLNLWDKRCGYIEGHAASRAAAVEREHKATGFTYSNAETLMTAIDSVLEGDTHSGGEF